VGRQAFLEAVFDVVARIPRGRVTTYGRIAWALGEPRAARMVGWALHAAPPERQLPCQRVVNRNGELTGGWHWGHPEVMKGLLVDEGVPFCNEYQVDLPRCLWEPDEDARASGEIVTASAPADEMNDLDLIPVPEDPLTER
jgi:methylated-DNA-protein-cysteine methyltransferase-like protein